jgi:hypothetical protein
VGDLLWICTAPVESASVEPVAPEALVETDRATLHFRKYYLEELQRSS